jgi:hypothetical protein
VFFSCLDGVDEKVCFGKPQNNLWSFFKDLDKCTLERLGYNTIQRQAMVSGKIDKDAPSLFMIFYQSNCSIYMVYVVDMREVCNGARDTTGVFFKSSQILEDSWAESFPEASSFTIPFFARCGNLFIYFAMALTAAGA